MTAAPEPGAVGGEAAFDDGEPVFTPASGPLDMRVPVPRFGERILWDGACLPRPSNVTPANWRISFARLDPVWNLRAREAAFALFNPPHPVLRAVGVFRLAQPAHLTTVRQLVDRIGVLGRWAGDHGLPAELGLWDADMLGAFLAGRVNAGASRTLSLQSYRSVLAALYELRDVLTGGGLRVDPAPLAVTGTVPTTPTPSIEPAVWWPLLRAAWTYIDCFAEDILTARDQALARPARPARPTPAPVRHRVDERLDAWLADPDTRIPVHAAPFRTTPAATPMWSVISMILTDGANHTALDRARKAAAPRRRRIWAEAARGRTLMLTAGQAQARFGVRRTPAVTAPRQQADLDAPLEVWLADPGHLVPVTEEPLAGPHPEYVHRPRWAVLARLVYGADGPQSITASTAAGRRRRAWVLAAVAAGRYQVLTGQARSVDLPRPTGHFAHVSKADGTRGPWRSQLTDRELTSELRALQGAVYCFVAALSMMRDSEIQEIGRGALTVHYGSPAVRSHKRKNEPAPIEEKWWIIDPVARALAVLERLSPHPTHLFTTPADSGMAGGSVPGRRGVQAAALIDTFIAHVNAHHTHTGLEPIPEARVRPHQFRKTMSVICAQEPDGEIALGIQLKHAARRVLANPTTRSYAAPDGAWMREFDDRLATAAADRLTRLLAARGTGRRPVAVGPAAGRLHDGLDRAAAQLLDTSPGQSDLLQALVADARSAADLLRTHVPELHLGILNHCLFQPDRAECTRHLPETDRGQPLTGACQPARCRNSAVTADHAPIWLAEHRDLTQQLREHRLSPPRRAALQARLDDVEAITTALTRDL
ncbi:hypothetical protein [Streptomyces sp. NPDC001833]|uniref:hypothetical protein n=1 Tax=Streptomyces sp. NPDC001833 TaxID=3154658 RepID=UPI00332D18FD